MEKTTRRKLLAAGVTTVAAGTTAGLLGQDEPAKKPPYNFQNISPRELIRRRHLPNVESITQNGKQVHFYDDLIKDKGVVIQLMFNRCGTICPVINDHLEKAKMA